MQNGPEDEETCCCETDLIVLQLEALAGISDLDSYLKLLGWERGGEGLESEWQAMFCLYVIVFQVSLVRKLYFGDWLLVFDNLLTWFSTLHGRHCVFLVTLRSLLI